MIRFSRFVIVGDGLPVEIFVPFLFGRRWVKAGKDQLAGHFCAMVVGAASSDRVGGVRPQEFSVFCA